MAHWHDFNPWASTLVYVPSLEEWVEAHEGLNKIWDCSAIGGSPQQLATVEWLVDHCLNNARIQQGTSNPKVDAYILPQPSGMHDMGLRIGPAPEQYHSPPCNPVIAEQLIKKYGGKP